MKILLVTVLSFLCLNIFSKDYEYEVIAEDLSSPWGIAMICLLYTSDAADD